MFVKVFLEDISIWFCRLSKGLPSCGQASANPLRARIEQIDDGRGKFRLFSWAGMSIFSWSCTLEFMVLGVLAPHTFTTKVPGTYAFCLGLEIVPYALLGLRPQTQRLNYTTWFLGSPAYRHRLWDFWTFRAAWDSSYLNQSLYISYDIAYHISYHIISISYHMNHIGLFIWRTLPNTFYDFQVYF